MSRRQFYQNRQHYDDYGLISPPPCSYSPTSLFTQLHLHVHTAPLPCSHIITIMFTQQRFPVHKPPHTHPTTSLFTQLHLPTYTAPLLRFPVHKVHLPVHNHHLPVYTAPLPVHSPPPQVLSSTSLFRHHLPVHSAPLPCSHSTTSVHTDSGLCDAGHSTPMDFIYTGPWKFISVCSPM